MGRNTKLIRLVLLGGYSLLLLTPGYTFLQARGGWEFLDSLGGFKAAMVPLFPLFGLYAFTFLGIQALIGPNTSWLGKYFVDINNWHRRQGVFTLLLAILHPLAILIGFGIGGYLDREFVAPSLTWWLLPAYAALILLLATAGTAILNWRGYKIYWWRQLHRFNYLVFGLAWLHSWFIGSDVRNSNLKYIWLFYLIAVLLSASRKAWPAVSHSKESAPTT